MASKSNSQCEEKTKNDIQGVRLVVVCAFFVLVVGMSCWFADPGSSLGYSARAEDSYYNLLVQGFRSGQLNIKREAPSQIAALADPYGPGVSQAVLKDVKDLSYYKGKLYIYFGVTPVVILFWPYATLTGHYLSDKEGVIIFFALGCLVAAGLLRAIWRRYFAEVSFWVMAPVILISVLSVVLTFWCGIYLLAIVCGFALVMLALAALWRALHEPEHQIKWLLGASLAYGLAIGSRPTLLFGAVILLLPVVRAWQDSTVSRWKVGWLLIAASGPITTIGLGLMAYNYLRFDNPFEFGWHYQLTEAYHATTAQQLSSNYLWFNVRYYFLELPRWGGPFPFLQNVPLPRFPAGYDIGTPGHYGGIPAIYPFILLAAAAPLAWRGRPGQATSGLRWFAAIVFLLFIICASTLCLYLTASDRYEMDFLPPLLLLTSIGILGIERSLAHRPLWQRAARCGWGLLLGYSIVFNLLVNVEAHAEANFLTGNSLLSDGHLDQAIARYQRALALWSGSADALAGLGNASFQKGQIDEAINDYKKALEITPKFAAGHNNLAFCFLSQGRLDEAIGEYQKAIELQPGSPMYQTGLGNAFFQKGQINLAIVQYQKALEIDPGSADIYFSLGNCYLQAGRADEAVDLYRKAVELQPDSATFHYALGNALFQSGRKDESIVEYGKVLAIKPDDAQADNNLGYALMQAGRVSESIKYFQAALNAEKSYEAYYNLGYAYNREGIATNAVSCYQKSLELQPQFITAQNSLAWILATWPDAAVRDGKQAVVLAEKANTLSGGNDVRILRTLAAAYAEAGRFPEAIATAKKALSLLTPQSDAVLINELKTEIGLYQNNSPCRSTT